MVVRFGKKLLVCGWLIAAGALSAELGFAQRSTGSLTGVLTDAHSTPLENVTITLRNTLSGSSFSETTTRKGRYRFENLPDGEYALSANGPQGSGEVGGITISSGHESHVQTAIDLTAPNADQTDLAATQRRRESQVSAVAFDKLELLKRASEASRVDQQQGLLEASVPFYTLALLPVSGSARSLSRLALHVPELSPVPVASAAELAELEPMGLAALQDALLAVRLPSKLQAAVELENVPFDVAGLDASQLEALPITENWVKVLSGAGPSSVEADERGAAAGGSPTSVDGLRLRSAFRGSHLESGGEFLPGLSAVSRVRRDGLDGVMGGHSGHGTFSIDTRRGTDRLHGQLFVLDRQRMLSAQNSSMLWVKESAPGSASTVPTFTSDLYTPSDLELRWGAGIGGSLRRPHFLWFGAAEGAERNNPALATVRHPDRFFAQPSNDQMQFLSAQLGFSGFDSISQALNAYSKLLESLAGLLGPAARSSHQLSVFGRVDWGVGERQRLTLEGGGKTIQSPGGSFARPWQTYGSHSLGSMHTMDEWLRGRWEARVTSSAVAITQGAFGHRVQSLNPGEPSAFEQSLNISAWGQLPQIVVDSRDGFTIGNPARVGRGRYPDESVYSLQQQIKWVHGKFLLNMGGELSHEANATNRLPNQGGTYYYADVAGFASDALSFLSFGLNGQLNPMDQHNCDRTGKPWRDATGMMHGLGYLPCYSYYSQTMGPADWWMSTNDWRGFATSQWQPNKRTTLTLGMRWDLQQLPDAIRMLDNLDLPLTRRMPSLGNQWGPRVGFAWGSGESHWPVVRLGYGMYFSRTPNATVKTALTQTGSAKGDLNFFIRPTDNLSGAGGPPFPYVLTGEPGSIVKPGAVEFAPSFHNGEVHQAELSLEERLPGKVHLEASGVASLGRRLPVTMDANIDAASNPQSITYTVVDGNSSGPIRTPQITVPFFASWPSAGSSAGGRLNPNYQQVSELFSRANSTYEAMMVRLSRSGRGLTFRGRYTFAHNADWNPDESTLSGGPSVLDPIDFRQEYGASDLDRRHHATAAVIVQPKFRLSESAGLFINGWTLSGVGHFSSGLPYTMRTTGSLAKEFDIHGQAIVGLSTGMNGYGGDNRVYGVGRNTYRYPSTWNADLRVTKRFDLHQMRQLELIAESFNLFNHQNVTQIETVGYSIEQGTPNGIQPRLSFLGGLKSGRVEFGKPLNRNASDLYHQRQFQFGARMRF